VKRRRASGDHSAARARLAAPPGTATARGCRRHRLEHDAGEAGVAATGVVRGLMRRPASRSSGAPTSLMGGRARRRSCTSQRRSGLTAARGSGSASRICAMGAGGWR
jgi:hypothetical protein